MLRAAKALILQCGDTTIELGPDALKLVAKSIEGAAGGITLSGDGPSLEMGDDVKVYSKSITMYAKGSTVDLGKTATVKGDKISLAQNQAKPLPPTKDAAKDTQPFACQFSDFDLRPYADKIFHLRAEGLKVEGKTDGDGKVTADLPKGVKQVVVTIWIDEYPTGRRRTYTLTQAEIPPANTPRGAQLRLLHLGYLTGEPGDEMTAEANAALLWFQGDHRDSHGLTPSGELDGPTAGALKDVYGS